MDLHPTTDILLQSLVFFPQRCRDRLLQPPTSSVVVLRSSAKRYPADGQAIPPLRTSCYSLPSVGPLVPEPVKFPTPLRLRLHCRVFPIFGSFQSRASPSSIASLHSARRGQQTRVIGRGLYVESLTAGTHEVHGRMQGKFLFTTHCTWTVRGKCRCQNRRISGRGSRTVRLGSMVTGEGDTGIT